MRRSSRGNPRHYPAVSPKGGQFASMWFIHEKYDGTDVMLEIPKKATVSMVDGKKVLTFTL